MRVPGSALPLWIVPLFSASVALAKGGAPTAQASAAAPAAAAPAALAANGSSLPDWHEPDAYSVDLVVHGEGQTFTMERAVDHGKRRSHIALEGQEMVLLELPDEQGTTYTLMPAQKMALKQTADALAGMAPAPMAKAAPDTAAKNEHASDAKVEPLGDEVVDGKSAHKYRVTFATGSGSSGTGLAWFDPLTNAPIRMEAEVDGKKSTLEWKNFQVGPQKAELFEVPKEYQVQDVGQMMKMMQGMSGRQFGGVAAGGGIAAGGGGEGGPVSVGGVPGGQGLPGGAPGGLPGGMPAGIPGGLPGGLPGGIPGMPGGGFGGGMSGVGERMGSHFGQQFGESVGAGFGGPLGAMAGRYIGGKVGGFLGRKLVGAF